MPFALCTARIQVAKARRAFATWIRAPLVKFAGSQSSVGTSRCWPHWADLPQASTTMTEKLRPVQLPGPRVSAAPRPPWLLRKAHGTQHVSGRSVL